MSPRGWFARVPPLSILMVPRRNDGTPIVTCFAYYYAPRGWFHAIVPYLSILTVPQNTHTGTPGGGGGGHSRAIYVRQGRGKKTRCYTPDYFSNTKVIFQHRLLLLTRTSEPTVMASRGTRDGLRRANIRPTPGMAVSFDSTISSVESCG